MDDQEPLTVTNTMYGSAGTVIQIGRLDGPLIVNVADVLSDRLVKAAHRLAGEVRGFWRRERQRRKVHDPWELEVGWRPAEAAVTDHEENSRRAGEAATPPVEVGEDHPWVVEVYRRIPSRRLVVLGREGSGKTVLAVRLTLALLKVRQLHERVPVIVGLGAWNPENPLETWVVEHLIRDHPFLAEVGDGSATLAAELVAGGWILPVLDGFDEVADGLHEDALRALSADTPLVLTSRPGEYDLAVAGTRGVHRAAVVELTDLPLDEVKEYLRVSAEVENAATRWDPVLALLDHDPASPVVQVLKTPLMVALARAIYSDDRNSDPSILVEDGKFPTVEALEHHLLSGLVPSVYRTEARDERSRRWTPERAQRWLGTLAAHPSDTLSWWELSAGVSRWKRVLMIAVLAGLAFGTVTGIGNIPIDLIATSFGPGFAIRRGLVVGALHGLVGGVAFGLLYWFADRRDALKPEPVRVRFTGGTRRLGARLATRLGIGIPIGLVLGSAVVVLDRVVVAGLGFDDGLGGGLSAGVRFVAGVGFGVGVVLGLMAWLEAPIDIEKAASPSDLLAVSRANVAAHMLVWAVVFGVAGWLSASVTESPLRSLETGLVFGLEAAFAGGLGYGLSLTAWGQWVAIVRIWLPLTRRLPWRLIAFLDDACRRGALRQAGAVYEFRHAQLRNHFAASGHDAEGSPGREGPPKRTLPAGTDKNGSSAG